MPFDKDAEKKKSAPLNKGDSAAENGGRDVVQVRFVGEKSLREALVAYFSRLKK